MICFLGPERVWKHNGSRKHLSVGQLWDRIGISKVARSGLMIGFPTKKPDRRSNFVMKSFDATTNPISFTVAIPALFAVIKYF